jgi:hypothetical protein
LVATDASDYLVLAALRDLVGELGIGYLLTSHRDEVSLSARDDRFGNVGIIQAANNDHRNAFQALLET